MAKKIPKTRFPDAVAVSYFRELKRMVKELGTVTLQIYNDQVVPQINAYGRADATNFKTDGPLDVIKRTIEIIKGLSLGIFSPASMQNAASRFVNSLNAFNANNMQAQGRIKGIDPTQHEPWLDEYMRNCIHENVSYISTIRDDFFPKIESIIYQGVKNGLSTSDIRDQLVKQIGMTENRAQFIAVDQTGSILGQMTAKRHQEMGAIGFRWVDSGDSKVRKKHKELNGKAFSYANPPSEGLPGTPFRCRCTADPIFDEEELFNESTPDFLRINANKNDNPDDVKAIQNDLAMIPENHRKLLSETVKEIRIVNKGASNYNRKTGVVNILEGMEEGELVHELGHALETKLNLYKNKVFKAILKNALKGKTPMDIYWDINIFVISTWILTSDNFISEYQGKVYEDAGFMGDDGELNLDAFGEYFAEGYREYVQNPEHLKKKDPELYNFIEGLK